ncbi:hypothetical protein CEUSTIGMA_g13840.t1 [Chlamydomonas eustigma]|uniref:Uncharacterized protein n=1 Tax=Chlamydomonas eustigma TaxID=1157962 RepID=A0A250XUF0_9CHLO|nr:hypothetical protein CEUSTIGMA_g13840.t1 [Chlamydomonas eustigma]|eukprot:GAX86430.1 hypothetical protein CEUSTIGMA_g13840.t1 [Chlamydomonas eustigma]
MARRRNRSLTTACSENEGAVDVFPLLFNLTDELLRHMNAIILYVRRDVETRRRIASDFTGVAAVLIMQCLIRGYQHQQDSQPGREGWMPPAMVLSRYQQQQQGSQPGRVGKAGLVFFFPVPP